MAMQRNNIATRFSRERKAALVRWREVDGMMPGEIAARAGREWPELPRIHGTTWQTWAKGAEYKELRGLVSGFEKDLAADRLLASVINEGRGPESITDLIVMDVARELRGLTRNGIGDANVLANVTKALAPILRKQAADAKLALDTRLQEAEAKHINQVENLNARIADLQGELELARNEGKAVDGAAVADKLNDVLGVKKA
jgi:hypothetical protein